MGGGGKMGKTQSSGAGGLQRWKEREREGFPQRGGMREMRLTNDGNSWNTPMAEAGTLIVAHKAIQVWPLMPAWTPSRYTADYLFPSGCVGLRVVPTIKGLVLPQSLCTCGAVCPECPSPSYPQWCHQHLCSVPTPTLCQRQLEAVYKQPH